MQFVGGETFRPVGEKFFGIGAEEIDDLLVRHGREFRFAAVSFNEGRFSIEHQCNPPQWKSTPTRWPRCPDTKSRASGLCFGASRTAETFFGCESEKTQKVLWIR